MSEKLKAKLAVVLFVLAVALSGVACGGQCYSQFDGCPATAEALATAAAMPKE